MSRFILPLFGQTYTQVIKNYVNKSAYPFTDFDHWLPIWRLSTTWTPSTILIGSCVLREVKLEISWELYQSNYRLYINKRFTLKIFSIFRLLLLYFLLFLTLLLVSTFNLVQFQVLTCHQSLFWVCNRPNKSQTRNIRKKSPLLK